MNRNILVARNASEADLKLILARVDARRTAVNLSDRALSLKAGLSADAVRSMRRGNREGTQRGVSTDTIKKLAIALRTTPEWLLSGVGLEDVEPGSVVSGDGGNGGGSDIDPIIAGLLNRLPKSGAEWPMAQRKRWLQLLEGSFNLIYTDKEASN